MLEILTDDLCSCLTESNLRHTAQNTARTTNPCRVSTDATARHQPARLPSHAMPRAGDKASHVSHLTCINALILLKAFCSCPVSSCALLLCLLLCLLLRFLPLAQPLPCSVALRASGLRACMHNSNNGGNWQTRYNKLRQQ